MEFKTTDISLVSFICMRGHRVVEIKPVIGAYNALQFVLDCSIDLGRTLQDEFMQSEFRDYYESVRQVKSLLRVYKERQSFDKVSAIDYSNL